MNRCRPGSPDYTSRAQLPTSEIVRPLRRRSPVFESAYSNSYSCYHNTRPRLVERLYSKYLTQGKCDNEGCRCTNARRSKSFIKSEENHHDQRKGRAAYESIYGTCNAVQAGYATQQEIDAEFDARIAREAEMIAQQTRMMATEEMISENEQRIISNESRIMGQESVTPPQTVELYEGSDDPLEDETQQNIANKLGCEGAGGYIDTIVNFDEKEGELNISNVFKIGDQVIHKEWDCGKEYRETIEKHRSASRNLSRSSKRFKNETFEMNDSFDGSRMTVSRKIFDEDQSVEPNPTVERKTFNRHKFKHNVENCDCDLCQQDEEVFWETSRPLSHRRSSLKRSRRDTSRESAYEESVSRTSPLKKSASKEHTRKSWNLGRSHKRASLKRRSQSFANLNETSFGEEATPPRRSSNRSRGSHSRSSLKKSGRASSANRKSVSFKELVDEDFRPNYSLYSTQRKPLKRSTKSSRKSSRKSSSVHSPSFGANNSVVDDTCDFEELEFVDSIPTEGKKSLLRNSGFSATKDKTSRGTHSFFSPNNGLSLANLEHNYRMTEIKNPKRISSTIKHPRQGSMTVHMPPSYDSLKTVQRGSRDNARTRSMKQIALRLVKYGELQQFENSIKNTLCMQPNYNAGFGFSLLNPDKGSVDAGRLHNALLTNLKIYLVEKQVVEDLIARLAYSKQGELVLSDMAFFEPERGDPSYPTYRRNFSKDQDEDDSSWQNLYKELWKALINTTKQRRIIQNDMCEAHPDGIDYMFEECGIEKSDKFTGEDIEYFLSQQLQTTYEPNFIRAVIQSLDNDQDGVVSYYEFLDAMYGAV